MDMHYQDLDDKRVVALARAGDCLAWIECLARGLESRVLFNVKARG
jgi:hypothetical protein